MVFLPMRCLKPGWWGFAALTDADFTISHEGAEKAVEIGAVIWVKFHEMVD